jgi:hypothetical protein
MKDIKDIKNYLILSIADLNRSLKHLEETCAEVGVDPRADRAYIAIMAKKIALNEALQYIMS